MSSEFLTASFRRHSHAHQQDLRARGYRVHQQLFLDSFLLHNSPWKTYWRVLSGQGVPGFVKVNYGYESSDLNRIMGFKEAALAIHLTCSKPNGSHVLFPDILDHWQSHGSYFVVSRWQELERISLQQCLRRPQWFDMFLDLLSILRSAGRPGWWSETLEHHNFSQRRQELDKISEGALFGFDLDDNMSITNSEELFVNDFEFFQWDRNGLQDIYLSLKVMCTSRREMLWALRSNSKTRHLLEPARSQPSFRSLVEQGARAWRAKLERNNEYNLAAVIRLRLARVILHGLRALP